MCALSVCMQTYLLSTFVLLSGRRYDADHEFNPLVFVFFAMKREREGGGGGKSQGERKGGRKEGGEGGGGGGERIWAVMVGEMQEVKEVHGDIVKDVSEITETHVHMHERRERRGGGGGGGGKGVIR